MRCGAKIRPLVPTSDLELQCESEEHPGMHGAILHDYAYPGSATIVKWEEEDRRTFYGEFTRCNGILGHCVLPTGHRGDHAI